MLSFEIRNAHPGARVQSKPTSDLIPNGSLSSHLQRLSFHLHTAYLFVCTDIPIVCITTLFGALSASVAPRLGLGPSRSFLQILASLPLALLWSWSNLFLFNLHNQRHPEAIAEDAMNKPWRPLPAGRISPEQTLKVVYFMYPVTFISASVSGGVVPCIVEAVLSLLYNERGGSSIPFLKNIMTALGLTCFLAGPLEGFTQHSVLTGDGTAALWLLILAAAMAVTIHATDFRDMEGDRKAGRKTVPLVMGDTNARVFTGIGVAACTFVACWFWGANGRDAAAAWVAGTAMVVNIFLNRNKSGDRLTGKAIYPLWLLGMFMIPAL